MKARYQYRIYPTHRQAQRLSQVFGCTRVVWNDALALCRRSEKLPSNGELQKLVITQAKQAADREWLAEVSNIPLQQSVSDLGVAFKNFFESMSGKRKGPKVKAPNFKKRSNQQSARYRKGGFSLKKNKLFLAKLGTFKVKWSRPLPAEASSVTIIKDTSNRYFASFVVEVKPVLLPASASSIGVDLGIKTFAFLSTGEAVRAPDCSKLDRKIRRFQRQMARQVKGSNRRSRTRIKIAKLQAKVKDIRKDFLHKLSTRLVSENQAVCLEDLNVKGMVKNRKLARAISKQGWGQFRTFCESKAKKYIGRTVNIISRWEPTSQTCSDCGFRWGKLNLSIRSILCVSCGAEHDRDENAAKNIQQVGVGRTHDSKRTVRARKPASVAMPVDLFSPSMENQLCLSL
jgi:putative transposase